MAVFTIFAFGTSEKRGMKPKKENIITAFSEACDADDISFRTATTKSSTKTTVSSILRGNKKSIIDGPGPAGREVVPNSKKLLLKLRHGCLHKRVLIIQLI